MVYTLVIGRTPVFSRLHPDASSEVAPSWLILVSNRIQWVSIPRRPPQYRSVSGGGGGGGSVYHGIGLDLSRSKANATKEISREQQVRGKEATSTE